MRQICFLLTLIAASAAGAVEIVPGSEWTVVCPVTGIRGLDKGYAETVQALSTVLAEGVGVRVRTDGSGSGGRHIYLGPAAAEKAGFMKGEYEGFENSIAEKDGNLYFFGRDRAGADPDRWQGCFVPSVMAAVRFMRKFVGAEFVMPGAVGTEVPHRDRVIVPDGYCDRERPRFDFGAGRYPGGIVCCYANGIVGHAGYHTYGGHTYPAACPRQKHFRDHPEYFGMKDGKRHWGTSDGCQAYCISNRGFQELLYAELLRRYDAGADVCQLGQHDGWAVCECPECEAMYGTGKDWGEKFWLFHKEIAERIQKERPGKLVHIMSYAHTAQPPRTFKAFPSNVLIEVCNYSRESLRRWRGYVVPNGFTYYLYNWSWYPILGLTAKRSFLGLVSQVRLLHESGLRGIYRCGYGELFGTEGPAYWVFNRFLQKPDLEIEPVVSEYCRLTFGPAWSAMKSFYDELDRALCAVDTMTSGHWEAEGPDAEKYGRPSKDPLSLLAFVYAPARVAAMEDFLQQAFRTSGLSAKHRKRLELVRIEFDYARMLGEIATLYAAYRCRPSRALYAPLAAALRRRAAFVDAQYEGNGMVRCLEGWPELRLFGGIGKAMMRANGRMSAAIGEPISWDLDKLEKYDIIPDERMTPAERKAEIAAKGLKPLTGWAPHDGPALEIGSFFRPYADGTGFAFGTGSNANLRVSRRVGTSDGLVPGRTYRVTWITRYRNVHPNKWWRGYFFTASYDRNRESVFEPTDSPKGKFLKGTAPWTKRTAIVTVCDRKDFASVFSFRFWDAPGSMAEVALVTLEEIKE